MKKILVSHGYGAGWSSWNSGEVGKYMLTYQPIIDFVEAGGEFKASEVGGFGEFGEKKLHPLLQQLADECKERFGKQGEYVCFLGADGGDLQVETVHGAFKIREYDGSESVEYKDADDWEDAGQ